MHFMPQNVTRTPFRAPSAAILHFDLFGVRPEIFENLLRTLKIYITDVCFFTKKVGHRYIQYTKNDVQIFLVYQCFDLI